MIFLTFNEIVSRIYESDPRRISKALCGEKGWWRGQIVQTARCSRIIARLLELVKDPRQEVEGRLSVNYSFRISTVGQREIAFG